MSSETRARRTVASSLAKTSSRTINKIRLSLQIFVLSIFIAFDALSHDARKSGCVLASLSGSKNSRLLDASKKAVTIFQKRGRRGRNTRLRAPKNKERTDRVLFNAIKASESNFVLRATLSKEEGGGKKSEDVVPLSDVEVEKTK